MSSAVIQKAVTPLAVCVINQKQFKVTKASVSHTLYGAPSQFSVTMPLSDAFGKPLVDSTTLTDCWNSAFQPFDLYMGASVQGQPATLDYLGTGMVDTCATRYTSAEGEMLQLDGPDFLGLFSQTEISPTHYLNSKSSDIAKSFALGHNLVPQITPTFQPIKAYYQQDTSYLTSDSESQLDMLHFMAQLEGFIFYVAGQTFYFGPPVVGSVWDAYYKDGVHNDTVYDLEITRHPRGNKNIVVIGQTYDRHHKSTYVIGQSKGQTGPLVPGAGISFDLPPGVNPFSGAGLNFTTTTAPANIVVQEGAADASLVVQFTAPPGTNSKTLKALAKRKLVDLLHAERTFTATTPGDTRIARNTQIVLHGGRVVNPATGTYYVSELKHNFDPQGGFTTAFTGTNFPYGFQTS